jgi:putative redox protein
MENVQVYASKGSYRQSVRVGNHVLVSDAKLENGGTGSGPEPHDFLSVALASCTSMTLQMYARRKEMPLEGVQVAAHFKRNEAGETLFQKKITLEGPLSEEQKQRLYEIADKCPVNKILLGTIKVERID